MYKWQMANFLRIKDIDLQIMLCISSEISPYEDLC